MKKKWFVMLLAAVCLIAGGKAFIEHLIYEAVPQVGIISSEEAVSAEEAGFTEVLTGLEAEIYTDIFLAEPYEAVVDGRMIYILGRDEILPGQYEGHISVCSHLLGTSPESRHASIWMQEGEYTGLQKLGDTLSWVTIHRASGKITGSSRERQALNMDAEPTYVPRGTAPLIEWNDTLYWYEGDRFWCSLHMMDDSTGKSSLIADDVYYEGNDFFTEDGILAYLPAERDRILRMDLETGEIMDQLGVQNVFFDQVHGNRNYVIAVSNEGDMYSYCYDTGELLKLGNIQVLDNRIKPVVYLRGSRVWSVENDKIRVWDLETRTVTCGFLPKADYSDYSLNEEGVLAACSRDAHSIAVVRVKD